MKKLLLIAVVAAVTLVAGCSNSKKADVDDENVAVKTTGDSISMYLGTLYGAQMVQMADSTLNKTEFIDGMKTALNTASMDSLQKMGMALSQQAQAATGAEKDKLQSRLGGMGMAAQYMLPAIEGMKAQFKIELNKAVLLKYFKEAMTADKPVDTKAAEEAGFNIRGAEIMDPAIFPDMDKMVALMVELRKGKMTEEQCRKSLSQANYFGTMLVKMGYADALLGGATYSTADTVRPALQIIKTKPGSKIVSSCFIMVRPSATGENEVLAMADCAINIKPTEDELVEIAVETARTAKVFGIDPKVAFLSYSTLGSGKGEDVDKMRNACEKAKAAMPDVPVDGEFQFDAAVSPVVAKTKHITSAVGGHANTFIFPDINAGNIGYKICQRMGNFDAYGPILQGLNAPINDLSRGCNALEVYSMAIITAGLVD